MPTTPSPPPLVIAPCCTWPLPCAPGPLPTAWRLTDMLGSCLSVSTRV